MSQLRPLLVLQSQTSSVRPRCTVLVNPLLSAVRINLFKVGWQGDLYMTVLYAHKATGDREVGIAVPLTRVHIELPSVPRAGDDLAGELAFADWSSRVWTGIVDGKERSVHVEQRDPNSVDLDRFSGSRGNVVDSRDSDKISHATS